MRSAFTNAVLSVERDGQAYLHSHAATPVSGERFGPPKSMSFERNDFTNGAALQKERLYKFRMEMPSRGALG